MVSALAPRGPDDSGVNADTANRNALGNARLAIIDTSRAGHQPMVVPGTAITYNGELFNFKELRAAFDYPWQSQSDTEVILAAWQKWGIDTPRRLRGMFAFVIAQPEGNRFFLC